MAVRTVRFAEFDGGACFWEYDYDDQQLRLKAWRCQNTMAFPTTCEIISTVDPTAILTRTVPAHMPGDAQIKGFEENIPVGVQNRFDITVDARGRVDGLLKRVWMGV